MTKRPLTDQERKDLRAVIDIVYQLTDKVKNPKSNLTDGELRGGIFPFLFLIGQALFTAARVALPVLLRTAVQVGARALPSIARGVGQALVRGATRAIPRIGQSATRVLNPMVRTGLRSTAQTGARGATQTGRTLAGTSVRKGLLSKLGTAATISGATGVIDMGTGDETYDLPPDEQFPEYRTTPLPTYAHEEGDVFQRQSAPEVEIPDGETDAPDAQADTPFNLAPLRYTPRVRNVFTAAQSRNPLSSAFQTSTLTATPSSQPVRPRDIGVFRGAGVLHRKKVLKKYGLEDKGYSIKELAEITGVPESTLQEVYNRGTGAYRTSPKSVRMKGSFKKGVDAPMSKKLSKEQWSMARVYSFLNNNPKHDNDLRPITIPKTEFVKEHTELVDILTKGSKKERLAEARKQTKELKGGMEAGEEDEDEECVNSPCGVHTFTTLKENGFPNMEVPEIARRVVYKSERGGFNDRVIDDALKPYVAVNITAGKGEVFSDEEIQRLLRDMKENQLSGVLFLTGDPDSGSGDHIVPILYRDGELHFVDEGVIEEIPTDQSLYELGWWSEELYDDVYTGVDRVVMLTPES